MNSFYTPEYDRLAQERLRLWEAEFKKQADRFRVLFAYARCPVCRALTRARKTALEYPRYVLCSCGCHVAVVEERLLHLSPKVSNPTPTRIA